MRAAAVCGRRIPIPKTLMLDELMMLQAAASTMLSSYSVADGT